MMNSILTVLILIEAFLFALTMFLVTRKRDDLLGEYIGTAFHLLLMPVIAGLPASVAGQAAGFLWVGCDVVVSTAAIWNARSQSETSGSMFLPVRMAGHLFAAIWVVLVSVQLNTIGIAVSIALALGFAGYTLAGGRLSEKVLAVPALLMMVWLLLLAWHVHQIGT